MILGYARVSSADQAKDDRSSLQVQMDVIEGGMTDGAIIYMNREGVPTGVLSIPTRYIHSATGVFNVDDMNAAIELTVKAVQRLAKE